MGAFRRQQAGQENERNIAVEKWTNHYDQQGTQRYDDRFKTECKRLMTAAAEERVTYGDAVKSERRNRRPRLRMKVQF